RVKVVLLYAELKSVAATQRRFRAVFHTRWAPSRNTILRLYRKLEANAVLDILHETFENRVMSHRYPQRHQGGFFWPPLSPDLNPSDFFLWGYLKEKTLPFHTTESCGNACSHCAVVQRDK
ncbi:hypothetical protein C0J52_04809, partial [Blattella germanica]